MFFSHSYLTILLALLGGILPALVWLFFWLREDKKHPEPKAVLLLAFIGGMIAVFLSLYVEKVVFNQDTKIVLSNWVLQPVLDFFRNIATEENMSLNRLLVVVIFAPIIEEFFKFIMSYFFALRSKDDDEPIDPMIYLITTALGFAAVENMLFLIDPITKQNIAFSILTGNMRFIGATLLHTISSATIGIFISFNFFDSKISKIRWILIGLVCAIVTHSAFNFFMIGSSQKSFLALEAIWIAVIIVLLVFERIKRIKLEKIK